MQTFLSTVHEPWQSSLDDYDYRQDDDDNDDDDDDDDDEEDDNNEKTDDDCLSHKPKGDFTIIGD